MVFKHHLLSALLNLLEVDFSGLQLAYGLHLPLAREGRALIEPNKVKDLEVAA